jgi:hypothetical protein
MARPLSPARRAGGTAAPDTLGNGFYIDDVTIASQQTPEPGTVGLLLAGIWPSPRLPGASARSTGPYSHNCHVSHRQFQSLAPDGF